MNNTFKAITFDVEHGSSHVIITPNNQVVMIDAGSRADFSPAHHLRYVWGHTQLRWLTVTHHDSDHLTDINNIAEHFLPLTLEQPTIDPLQLALLYPAGFSTPLEVFLEFRKNYTLPVPPMSDPIYPWGGVQFATFKNEYHELASPNMNDMSVVTFASFQGWTFIFPGDLEKQGWLKLLENEDFRDMVQRTSVFVASHHGRESGFCQEVFQYCTPNLVIISDKSMTDTSCTDEYRQNVLLPGLQVKNKLGQFETRRVLTTRNDGAIFAEIDAEGRGFFTIE